MELIADHKSQPGGRKYWKIPILQNPMSFDHKLLHNFWEHQNQAKAFTAMQRVPILKMSEFSKVKNVAAAIFRQGGCLPSEDPPRFQFEVENTLEGFFNRKFKADHHHSP